MLTALVPVHLDVLALRRAEAVAGPLADFAKLPWSNGRLDFNADRPWLGQSIQRGSLDPLDLVLEAGAHLHWTLPDGLTRAKPGRTFPIVPNRWLVERRVGRRAAAAWIVESDTLIATTAGAASDGVAYPVAAEAGGAPFMRLGRSLPLGDWRGEDRPAARTRLTAIGYGEAAFAAYYPSCRGVFGFHDSEAPLDERLEYRLFGWYDDPGDDPLEQLFAAGDGPTTDEILARLHWRSVAFDGSPEAGRPRRTLCFAALTLSAAGAERRPLEPPEVMLADTGLEALSALAARDHASEPERRTDVEATLDALHHFRDLEHLTADRPAQLQAKRHERTFVAQNGGRIWKLRALAEGDRAAEAETLKARHRTALPPTLAERLNRLNLLQADLDHELAALADLRTRLFADWSKYILSAYPSLDRIESALDLDMVRDFLERGDLAELRRREALVGTVDLSFADDGALTSATSPMPERTIAGRLRRELARILRKLEIYNATGLSGRRVGRPKLELDQAGNGALVFDGRTNALILDWIDGWRMWPSLGVVPPLQAFTVRLLVRPDSAKAGHILSFDADAHFALLLVKRGDDAFFGFATCSADGTKDVLVADAPVRLGQWVELAATYSAADGAKRLWVDGTLVVETRLPGGPSIGTGDRRWAVLGAASKDAVFERAAGPGRFHGAVARLHLDPAVAAAGPDLLAFTPSLPPSLSLTRENGPRFWAPRDPVVMLRGEAARASGRHDRGVLDCHLADIPAFAHDARLTERERRAWLVEALAHSAEVVEAIADRAPREHGGPSGPGFHVSDGAPWHPLFIEWETALHPVTENGPHGDGRRSYRADYVTGSFRLDPDGPELIKSRDTAAIPDRSSITSGRSVLTPFAARAHARHRQAALEAGHDAAGAMLDAASDTSDAQSQALGGFHAALLQHRQGLNLPPDDPLALGDRRRFSREVVRDAVGRQTVAASSPNQPFLPIRAGLLEIRRLWLIDAFGRVMDVPVHETAQPTRLAGRRQRPMAQLPPRLTQPARLNFRWLSARTGIEEMNAHPATTPVCGWLVPSYLDAALAVHATDGSLLGEIAPSSSLSWRPAPGALRPVDPSTFDNPTLARFTRHLAQSTPAIRAALIDAVHRSLDTIQPPLEGAADSLPLIMGRPLALVRARLGLELKGLPAVDQDWAAFARDLERRERDHAGYLHVRFPVRLGEAARLDDGLVLFWVEDDEGLPEGPARAPIIDRAEAGSGIVGRLDDGFALSLTLAGTPRTVTMLIDPRGAVHATSGIQPVKAISVPDDQYAPSLARIGATVLTAPLLAPGDQVCPPLPRLDGFTWAWRQRDGSTWRQVSGAGLTQPRLDGAFEGPSSVNEGWLVLEPVADTNQQT